MSELRSNEEETYPHEYLWRSASILLQRAEAEDKTSYHLLLPALLMSFMAYEAFINFCGFALLPERWKDEKKHFQGKGIEGKLQVIVEDTPGFVWRKGELPYQRIKKLETFRDLVAHAKVVAIQYVTEQRDDGDHFRFEQPWESYLSLDAIQNARTDIESFCESLLVELRKTSGHPHLQFKAFQGSLASGSSRPHTG